MIVKKTCRKRLTAFMSTARRYSHASPDIIDAGGASRRFSLSLEYDVLILPPVYE